jgi:hypothetical protein
MGRGAGGHIARERCQPGAAMGDEDEKHRWHSRPVLAGLTRTVLFAVPLALAVLAVRALHQFVLGDFAPWLQLAVSAVVGIVVALLTERATRRFLPLPALLRMSMLFPGRAPSRLLVTRRAGSEAALRRMLEARDPDPQQAATAMMALIGALAAHDKRSRGHCERVRLFTDMIADELTLTRGERDRLCWAALLHDVGKLEIATAILNKPGALNASEWERMRRHPTDGARLCAPLLAWLGPSGRGIAEHHEKYDGTGYPNGISGERISLAGRVIAVVDAYETMTAARPYKKPITTRAAREELAKCAASQFDPVIVKAFLAVSVPRMMWATGPFSLLTHLPYLRNLQLVGSQVASASASSAVQVAGVTALAVGTAVAPLTAATAAPTAIATPTVLGSVASPAGSSSRPSPQASTTATPTAGPTRQARGPTRQARARHVPGYSQPATVAGAGQAGVNAIPQGPPRSVTGPPKVTSLPQVTGQAKVKGRSKAKGQPKVRRPKVTGQPKVKGPKVTGQAKAKGPKSTS